MPSRFLIEECKHIHLWETDPSWETRNILGSSEGVNVAQKGSFVCLENAMWPIGFGSYTVRIQLQPTSEMRLRIASPLPMQLACKKINPALVYDPPSNKQSFRGKLSAYIDFRISRGGGGVQLAQEILLFQSPDAWTKKKKINWNQYCFIGMGSWCSISLEKHLFWVALMTIEGFRSLPKNKGSCSFSASRWIIM